MVAFLSVVAFLVAATVVFDLAFVLALAGLLAALVSFALAFFGGMVAYLPPETFRPPRPNFQETLLISARSPFD